MQDPVHEQEHDHLDDNASPSGVDGGDADIAQKHVDEDLDRDGDHDRQVQVLERPDDQGERQDINQGLIEDVPVLCTADERHEKQQTHDESQGHYGLVSPALLVLAVEIDHQQGDDRGGKDHRLAEVSVEYLFDGTHGSTYPSGKIKRCGEGVRWSGWRNDCTSLRLITTLAYLVYKTVDE